MYIHIEEFARIGRIQQEYRGQQTKLTQSAVHYLNNDNPYMPQTN